MDLYEQFNSIKDDDQLRAFLLTYGFEEIEDSTPLATRKWNLGEYQMIDRGTTFRVGYRWYDPSRPFSIQKDIHKAALWSIDATGTSRTHGDIAFEE